MEPEMKLLRVTNIVCAVVVLVALLGPVHSARAQGSHGRSASQRWDYHYAEELDWSPSGDRLLIGYADGDLEILDMITRQTTFVASFDFGVRAVDWSSDGTLVAAASGPDLCVFDASTGQQIARLWRDSRVDIGAIAWKPGEHWLANTNQIGQGAGFARYDVTVWDVASSEVVQEFAHYHTNVILSIDWSPDGSRLASTGADRTTIVWDATTQSPISSVEAHAYNIIAVAWNPVAGELATASEYLDNTVRIWDAVSEETTLFYSGTFLSDIAWSPNGDYLAVADSDQVQIIERSSGQVLTSIQAAALVETIAWSPDGCHLAYGGLGDPLVIVAAPVSEYCFPAGSAYTYTLTAENTAGLTTKCN